MPNLLVNIDVDDIVRAERFYCEAFGLRVGRRLGPKAVELLGMSAPLYLLEKPAGSPATGSRAPRTYDRHWTSVHLDFVVDDVQVALARAETAGARREGEVGSHDWGKIVVCADPFGNGFCLVEFSERGYDAIATG